MNGHLYRMDIMCNIVHSVVLSESIGDNALRHWSAKFVLKKYIFSSGRHENFVESDHGKHLQNNFHIFPENIVTN